MSVRQRTVVTGPVCHHRETFLGLRQSRRCVAVVPWGVPRVHLSVSSRRPSPDAAGWSSARGLVFAGFLGGAALSATTTTTPSPSPGPSRQEGQDLLGQRFGLTGTSGQMMFTATSGEDHRRRQRRGGRQAGQGDRQGPRRRAQQPADGRPRRCSTTDSTATLGQIRFSRAGAVRRHPRGGAEGGRPPAGSSALDLGGWRRLQGHGRPEQGSRAAGAAGLVPDPGADLRVAAGRGHADRHRR